MFLSLKYEQELNVSLKYVVIERGEKKWSGQVSKMQPFHPYQCRLIECTNHYRM